MLFWHVVISVVIIKPILIIQDSDSEDNEEENEEDDEEEEEDEDKPRESRAKRPKLDPAEMVMKRREKRLWHEKRKAILFNYTQFSFYSSSVILNLDNDQILTNKMLKSCYFSSRLLYWCSNWLGNYPATATIYYGLFNWSHFNWQAKHNDDSFKVGDNWCDGAEFAGESWFKDFSFGQRQVTESHDPVGTFIAARRFNEHQRCLVHNIRKRVIQHLRLALTFAMNVNYLISFDQYEPDALQTLEFNRKSEIFFANCLSLSAVDVKRREKTQWISCRTGVRLRELRLNELNWIELRIEWLFYQVTSIPMSPEI